jgi:putative ABC transport system substrate-binding protein
MKIRLAMCAVSLVLLAAPLAAEAQQPGKVYRIGILLETPVVRVTGSEPPSSAMRVFLQALRERGWVYGQNILTVPRSVEGRVERLPELAAELVALNVDVIMPMGRRGVRAAKQATSTIPIVVPVGLDLVEDGLVASLARPGGNLTGLLGYTGPELEGKQLDLLKEAVPRISRVAVLHRTPPAGRSFAEDFKGMVAAAQALRVTLLPVLVDTPDQFPAAFATMTQGRVDALYVGPIGVYWAHRELILEYVAKNRLPTMFAAKDWVAEGALMSYATDSDDLFRRAAGYVDKILRGARPGDMPIEQPTKFELVINAKTAKTLGLTIPPAVLARADEVIQ